MVPSGKARGRGGGGMVADLLMNHLSLAATFVHRDGRWVKLLKILLMWVKMLPCCCCWVTLEETGMVNVAGRAVEE